MLSLVNNLNEKRITESQNGQILESLLESLCSIPKLFNYIQLLPQ